DSRVDAVKKRMGFSGVVVSAQSLNAPVPSMSPARATLLQKGKRVTHHSLQVTVGPTLDFPNEDPIYHNAFSSYSGQIFDIGLYPPGTSRSVRFQRPGIVRVFCNIHATMSAIILVLTTPYLAVTPHDGSFHIDVPPGSYDLAVFHERATEPAL